MEVWLVWEQEVDWEDLPYPPKVKAAFSKENYALQFIEKLNRKDGHTRRFAQNLIVDYFL